MAARQKVEKRCSRLPILFRVDRCLYAWEYYVRLYVSMHEWYICMYVYIFVRMYMFEWTLCVRGCMYVRMRLCMYVYFLPLVSLYLLFLSPFLFFCRSNLFRTYVSLFRIRKELDEIRKHPPDKCVV